MNSANGTFQGLPLVSAELPNFFGLRPSSLAICTVAWDRLNRFRASNQGCRFGGMALGVDFTSGLGFLPTVYDDHDLGEAARTEGCLYEA